MLKNQTNIDNKANNNILRIGVILGKWYGGGVESVLMNYYRNIDRSKIQFDFICDSDSTNIPYDEINSLGGKIIICPPYQKILKYIRELKKIYKQNNYKIIHSNINALSVFPLYAAKKVGVPIRIAHSHSTSNKKEWKKNIVKCLLKPFSKMFATHYFACTEHAGRWLFGNRTFNQGKVVVINNGIDLDKYVFDEKIRKDKRKELDLKDTDIVIGHIGRFMKQKNHEFLIDIFNELHKKNNNYKLILIGQGPLKTTIEQKIKNLNLEKFVVFLGQRNNANEYYQAMDLFLFPSFYEGLGMVVIEAQTAGLPCVVSTEVPKIAKTSNKISFIELSQPIRVWTNEIEEIFTYDRNIELGKIRNAGYDIKVESKKLENEYQKLLKEADNK